MKKGNRGQTILEKKKGLPLLLYAPAKGQEYSAIVNQQ
jgi:hypothetical protein